MKKAFITGIAGQDGSYLAELLLEKGYEVHGLARRLDSLPKSNIAHLLRDAAKKGLFLYEGTLEKFNLIEDVVEKIQPDEIYNLAGPSNVRTSFKSPKETLHVIADTTIQFLELIKKLSYPVKFLNPSSCQIFGSPPCSPQNEETPANPVSPYGAAKAFSQQMVKIYREAYGLPCCSAILYNHESPRRGEGFVTTKIAHSAARIKKGLQSEVKLGNLEVKRDWGWAPDYAQAMWMMLQQEKVEDFIIATGKLHSVQDLVEIAFDYVGLPWKDYVKFDTELQPVVEPMASCGDTSKAAKKLGWQTNVSLDEIIKRMIDAEF